MWLQTTLNYLRELISFATTVRSLYRFDNYRTFTSYDQHMNVFYIITQTTVRNTLRELTANNRFIFRIILRPICVFASLWSHPKIQTCLLPENMPHRYRLANVFFIFCFFRFLLLLLRPEEVRLSPAITVFFSVTTISRKRFIQFLSSGTQNRGNRGALSMCITRTRDQFCWYARN